MKFFTLIFLSFFSNGVLASGIWTSGEDSIELDKFIQEKLNGESSYEDKIRTFENFYPEVTPMKNTSSQAVTADILIKLSLLDVISRSTLSKVRKVASEQIKRKAFAEEWHEDVHINIFEMLFDEIGLRYSNRFLNFNKVMVMFIGSEVISNDDILMVDQKTKKWVSEANLEVDLSFIDFTSSFELDNDSSNLNQDIDLAIEKTGAIYLQYAVAVINSPSYQKLRKDLTGKFKKRLWGSKEFEEMLNSIVLPEYVVGKPMTNGQLKLIQDSLSLYSS